MRCRQWIAWLTLLLAACGSSTVGGGGTPSPPAPSATQVACAASPSPVTRPPLGAAQALSTILVYVSATRPVRAGVLDVGSAACLSVGVSQRVAVHVRARVPPLPAEFHRGGPSLLSPIVVAPPVGSAAAALAGAFTLTFTAQAAGSTAISYLSETCDLPPGVC